MKATAWWVENFSRMGKKMEDLQHYLGDPRQRRQSPATMLTVLREISGPEGRMKFTKVKRGA